MIRVSVVTTAMWLGAVTASAGEPFAFENTFGRLPKDVIPIHYRVALAPDAKSMTTRGDEEITLRFLSATSRIQFNSYREQLSDVTLDGHPVESVDSSDETQLTTVTLASETAAGPHSLRFSFTGRIDETTQGLFLQTYVDPAGADARMLSTLMESTHARSVLPCWDEPVFRARFELSVTAPKAWTAVSNMPAVSRTEHDDSATTRFAPTPSMPSYLLELTLGDIASVNATVGNRQLGVWAVRGLESGGHYALENARRILVDYDKYFGVRYPLPKLDSIAIPGGFPGGMENWGAITYQEAFLLSTAANTIADRQTTYSLQAHEMAHMWFGDLVTMSWWDDIWLNESFASWMAAKETDRRHADWHWWLAQDSDKEYAMRADSVAGVHSIEQHITDESLIDNAFDPDITYSKGQAILRMLELWIGPDTFRVGVRHYMKQHAYSNAASADLWLALGSAARRDVASVATGWTEQPGFPLLTVESHCDSKQRRTLTVRQERFLGDGTSGAAASWKIPLMVRTGARGAPRPTLFDNATGPIEAGRCDEPVSLNADAIGYFRVAYDAPTLQLDTRAFNQLPTGDRLALLDDQWALASAGRSPLANYLALAETMKEPMEPLAWSNVVTAFEIVEFAERGASEYNAAVTYLRRVLKPVLQQIGWQPTEGEAPSVRDLRRQLFTDLGIWGDPEVIAEAQRRFRSLQGDHSAVEPDEQQAVLEVIAAHAGTATLERLIALARQASSSAERDRFYGALAQVQDPELAKRVIALALGKSLPPQANYLPLQLVFAIARRHPALAWKAFSEHADELLAFNPTFRGLTISLYSPQVFWSGVPLADVESYARAHVPPDMGPDIDRGLRSAEIRLKRKEILAREMKAYTRNLD